MKLRLSSVKHWLLLAPILGCLAGPFCMLGATREEENTQQSGKTLAADTKAFLQPFFPVMPCRRMGLDADGAPTMSRLGRPKWIHCEIDLAFLSREGKTVIGQSQDEEEMAVHLSGLSLQFCSSLHLQRPLIPARLMVGNASPTLQHRPIHSPSSPLGSHLTHRQAPGPLGRTGLGWAGRAERRSFQQARPLVQHCKEPTVLIKK